MELFGEGQPLQRKIVTALLALWRPREQGRIQVLEVQGIEQRVCGHLIVEARETVRGRRIGETIQVEFPCGTVRS